MSEIINFQAIFHLSEIISEVTYEISVVTYPSRLTELISATDSLNIRGEYKLWIYRN